MKFSEFFKENIDKIKSIQDKILDFFEKNPNPPDLKIHGLAKEIGVEPDKIETEIYKILSNILHDGKSKGKIEGLNKEQLAKGIKVESEHTSIPIIQKKIAADHLTEIPDYYDRLEKMESDAGIKEDVQGPFVTPLFKVKTDKEALVGLPDLKRICDSILEWWKTQDQTVRDIPLFVRIAKDLYHLK